MQFELSWQFDNVLVEMEVFSLFFRKLPPLMQHLGGLLPCAGLSTKILLAAFLRFMQILFSMTWALASGSLVGMRTIDSCFEMHHFALVGMGSVSPPHIAVLYVHHPVTALAKLRLLAFL